MKKEELVNTVYSNSFIKSLLDQLNETDRKNTEQAMAAVIDQVQQNFGNISKVLEERLAAEPTKTQEDK